MPTCNLLWLPAVYYSYLQSTMATYIQLCLSVVYHDYLQSTMATCSLLWLPTGVYYGYLQSIVNSCSILWLPTFYYVYNSFCAAQSALTTQLAYVCLQLYTLSGLYSIHDYPVCHASVVFCGSYSLLCPPSKFQQHWIDTL